MSISINQAGAIALLCLSVAAYADVPAPNASWEKPPVQQEEVTHSGGTGFVIEEGYVADSNNVQDPHDVYNSGYESGRNDAATRQGHDYSQHGEEYDYSTESAYARGYEDGFRSFGGAGAMHGGAGSGGGRR